jgi:sulfite exporter TauE/SafE/copper chaperone CopZ
MVKKTFEVKGMHCNSCSQLIENELKDKEGIGSVFVSYSKEQAEIDFDSEKISEQEIKDIIKKIGYEVEESEKLVSDKTLSKDEQSLSFKEDIEDNKEPENQGESAKSDKVGWFVLVGSLVILAFIIYYFFLRGLNIEIPGGGETGSIFLLFIVGILTGFHCVSMCGGFVVSYTTKNAIKGHKGFKQHLVYGGSKVISYAIIGGIFGLIGGIFAFSVGLRAGVAIFAGVFMIFYALSMLGIKFFRKFQINPKFLTRLTSKASKNAKGPYKGPFITGLLSGLFIACGPLQAMYLYAAGSGNFFTGMFGLAAFGLGTLPVMVGFGSLATVISHNTTRKILKISAIIVLVLGIIMLNRGLTVLGSPVSYDVIKEKVIGGGVSGNAIITNGVQEIYMEVNRYGWEPNSFVLKKGLPVKWIIDVKELTGCNNEIIVRDYDIDVKLKKGINTVEFTPDEVGTIRWSCWMGMIPGSFVVTEDGTASQQQIESAVPQGGGSCGVGGGGCGCGG